jgi:hypothetical protein
MPCSADAPSSYGPLGKDIPTFPLGSNPRWLHCGSSLRMPHLCWAHPVHALAAPRLARVGWPSHVGSRKPGQLATALWAVRPIGDQAGQAAFQS